MKVPASDLDLNNMMKDIRAYREEARKKARQSPLEGVNQGYAGSNSQGAADVVRLFSGFCDDSPGSAAAVYAPGNAYGLKKDLGIEGEAGGILENPRKIYGIVGTYPFNGRIAYVAEVSDRHPLKSMVVDLKRLASKIGKGKKPSDEDKLRGIMAKSLMEEIASMASSAAQILGEEEYRKYVAATMDPGKNDALGAYKAIFLI